jgi:hypothetical protein
MQNCPSVRIARKARKARKSRKSRKAGNETETDKKEDRKWSQGKEELQTEEIKLRNGIQEHEWQNFPREKHKME